MPRREGDGARRPDGSPAHGAGVAVDAGRHVDGEDRPARRVEALDDAAAADLEITVEAAAEQGVDDEPGPRRRDRVGGDERAAPFGEGARRVAAHALGRAEQRNGDLVAVLGKKASRDETVAAIMARPANDKDAARPGAAGHRDGCLGHRCAGARS